MGESSKPACWRDVALDLQQSFLETLGESDWDAFESTERDWLEKRVGYALHGLPDTSDKGDYDGSGYSQRQLKNTREVCEAIVQADIHGQGLSGDTWMSIICVCIQIPVNNGEEPCVKPVPVFRIPQFSATSKETTLFVDSNARVYVSWNDFLRHNELPPCNYCYPKNGIYTADDDGNVQVEYGKSPASNIPKKMLTVLDHASNALAVGATAVSMASLFVPVAGPFIAASVWGGISVGMYGAARATGALVDRKKHRQCVCIKNSDARNHWLSLVGNAVGAASAKAVCAVTKLTQTGQVVGKAGRLAVNALNVSSLAINGIGVVNGAFLLHDKHKHNELTPLDVLQFSSSILFFTHAAVTLKTADMIIKDTQSSVFQQFEASLRSNRHRKMFRKLANSTSGDMNEVEGNAKVIRGLMHIGNPDDFFAGLVRVDKQFRSTQSEVVFTETGHVEINQSLSIHPMEFSNINKDQRQVILQATKNLADGKLPETQFQIAVQPTVQEYNIQLQSQTTESQRRDVSQLLGINNAKKIYSCGQRAFANISSFDKVNILNEIMKQFDAVLHHALMELAVRLSSLLRWVPKLQDVLKFVCEAVNDIALKMENKYQADVQFAKNLYRTNFSQEEFDRNYHIEGKRFKHFCNIIIESYITNPVLLSFLIGAFEQWLRSRISVGFSEQMVPEVQQPVEQTRSIPRRFSVDDRPEFLPPDEVFKIAREVTGLDIDECKCILRYYGQDVTVVMPPGTGVSSVVLTRSLEDHSLTAYVHN